MKESIDVTARHIVHLGIVACFKEGDYVAALCGIALYPLAVFYAWLCKREYQSGRDPFAT